MTTRTEPTHTAPSRVRRVLGVLAAVCVGTAVATQSRINGELAGRIGDGVVAALISFGTGLALLALAALVSRRVRRGLGRVRASVLDGTALRPWHLLGGVFGGFLVISQGLTVGAIGVAVFTVAVVGGQVLSGLLVDRAGIGPGDARPVTATRVVGAVLAITAVLIAASGHFAAPRELLLAIIPALAGIGVAWQQAVNGRVGAVGGSFAAALINFTAGTLLILVVAAVEVAVRGLPGTLPTDPVLYLGGPIGLLFITVAAAIVRLTGVLLLGLGAIAGQLIAAVLLDLLIPAAGDRLEPTTLIGAGVTLVAVLIASAPRRARPAAGDT